MDRLYSLARQGRWGLLAGAFILAMLACPGWALDYPPGFSFTEVPDPLAGHNPVPALVKGGEPVLGSPFFDPTFNTVLTRIGPRGLVRHEYARFDPYNQDHSLVILHDSEAGDFMVYDTSQTAYLDPGSMVSLVNLAEPRWDPQNPDLIWGLQDLTIQTLNPRTQETTVVKDFTADPVVGPILAANPDIFRVTTRQEGEASYDLRYWGLGLQGTNDDYRMRYLLCWDRQEDRVLGLRALSPAEAELVDWVGMSPLGNWFIVGGDYGPDQVTGGLVMADRQLTSFHRLTYSTAHSDVVLDSTGREALVMQNTFTDRLDLIPLDQAVSPVTSPDDYAASGVTPLMLLYYAGDDPQGFTGGIHVSGNANGYAVISTYHETQAGRANWLDRSITLVRLDPAHPRAFYLAQVQNTTGSYWEETQATISRDGSRVLWASNWGEQVGSGNVFPLELTMPHGWRSLSGGQ